MLIEYTALEKSLNEEKLVKFIEDAKKLKVFGVCVPLAFVPLAKEELRHSPLKLITVIDFPLGNKQPHEKAMEVRAAKIFGADEVDMVIDYQALKNRKYELTLEGITAVVKEAGTMAVKVIIETSALNKYEIAIACALAALGGAHFIKTSTGFHTGGASIEDIIFIRSLLPDNIKIKASGGIRDKDTAVAMINAGADRIGSSKAGEILNAHN